MLKKYELAEQAMTKAKRIYPDSSDERYLRAMILASQGEKAEALRLIEGAERPYRYCVTCTYSMLEMKDDAIKNIQLGIDVGFDEVQHYLYSYLFLKKNPCFENLRDDPRFVKILKKRKSIYDQRIKKVKELL